ncbi:MAG: helix-turn-helix domain-containing protein [Polyangiales bacterium]
MARGPTTSSLRGILRPEAVGERFTLERRTPRPELAPYVERYWIVRWDLPASEPYVSETLPFPAVNLVFESGRTAVHGIPKRRFSRRLEGRGSVLGVKWNPGGFVPFAGVSMHALVDRVVPLEGLFGEAGTALDVRVLATDDDAERIACVEAFLLERRPPEPEPRIRLATEAVRVAEQSGTTRVEALAEQLGLSVRTLERLFRSHVGASPKWVLRRFRIHEAAERAAKGEAIEWARLADELGFADQAHLSKEFRAQVGVSPSAYARRDRAR